MTQAPEPLFGNWQRTQRFSVRGIGWKGAAFAAATYFAGLVLVQSNARLGTAVLLVCALVTTASAVRIGGVSLRQLVAGKARWAYATTAGATEFRAIDGGTWKRPGALHGTRLIGVETGSELYGVVHDPQHRRVTVAIDVASTAADLTDAAEQHRAVARWERWLEGLGRRPEVAWVTVVVDTSPSPGTRLREEVQRRLSALAPLDCRELMTSLAASSPAVAAQIRTRIAVTFEQRAWDVEVGRRGRRDGVTAYVPHLDRAVTSLMAGLDGCGVSVTGRVSPGQLASAVQAAFDPATTGTLDLVDDGTAAPPSWETAGPSSATERRDRYRHDSGTSATFVWAEAPRQLVPSTVLAPLVQPGRHRKRITVTYVATASSAAMDAATDRVRMRRAAEVVAGLPLIGRASTAQDIHDTDAAHQAAHEVAAGAGWIAQTITATVTVPDDRDLPAAAAELQHAAGASQLKLRLLYDLQAAAFAAGLPLGLSLPELAKRWNR